MNSKFKNLLKETAARFESTNNRYVKCDRLWCESNPSRRICNLRRLQVVNLIKVVILIMQRIIEIVKLNFVFGMINFFRTRRRATTRPTLTAITTTTQRSTERTTTPTTTIRTTTTSTTTSTTQSTSEETTNEQTRIESGNLTFTLEPKS